MSLLTTGPKGIGTDIGSDPVRREALDRARDSGVVAMTGPVHRLDAGEVSADEGPLSVVMYAPVYGGPDVPRDVTGRRAVLQGWTASVFRLDELVGDLGIGESLVQIDLAVNGATTDSSLVELPHSRIEQIDLYGQQWSVVFAPTASLGTPSRDWIAVLWGGAGTTLGLAAIVALLATQRSRLRREVDAAVAEAAVVNDRLERDSSFQRALLASLQVGVIFVDHRGRLRDGLAR